MKLATLRTFKGLGLTNILPALIDVASIMLSKSGFYNSSSSSAKWSGFFAECTFDQQIGPLGTLMNTYSGNL